MKDHANRTNIFGRARMLFMALLMVLTMTATAMSGTDAYAANDTVYVATYDQLQEALEETQGVKEIVIDPQAAVEKGEVVYGVEDDENSDAFYIGFDGPLTVSHDITITSADDVDVYFARSDSFRRDQGKPALLNIDSTGNLNLDGLITMTGEEVATTFYEADEENPAEFVFSVKSKDGTGEDNEVWNRGQALQGGFYIQNNGGEYTLGDDVIMEDINLADDVEGVEQIHEVEKTTLRSLFSSNKSEEEAVEEKAAEEEATQEEEVVVAPAPKRLMKNSLMSTTPTRGTTPITTFSELKTALANGTSPIVLDATFTKDGKNYFPISEPLTVDNNVVIQTKDNKEIILARSDKFKPEAETPAMFNVVSGGDLTLSNQVVMSGIEVKMPEKVNVKLSTGNAYLGIGKYGAMDQLKAVSSGAKEFSVNNGGFLTYYDGTKTCTFRYNFLTSDQNNAGEQDFRVKAVKKDGTLEEGYVTSLEEGKTYVAVVKILKYRPDGTTYYEENYMTSDGNSLSISTDRNNAVTFTATPSGGQNNVNYVVNPKTGDEAWTNEEVLPGGYFIYATGGGKVTLNSGVSLQGLNTTADVSNAAPVYVGGQGSKLNLAGAEIKNNLVGYAGGDETNSKLMVKDYNKYDIGEFVEGTTPTNSVGGIILDNEATAEFTSGKVNENRADVGAILVKNKAELKISGTEEGTTINGNVGFHHAGAVQVESGGKVKMTGGTMSDNVAWYKGGAVWATEWGTNGYANLNWNTYPFPTLMNPDDRKEGGYFSMDGGSLKNNMAFKRAGAIEVESNNVYLKSGVISGNTTRSLGGAIYVEGDNTTYTYTLVIENGYIGNNKAIRAGNSADNNKLNRYLDGTGKLTEASSSNPSSHDEDFTKWYAAGNGGGVWLCPRGGTASFTGQNVIIDNNKKERSGTDLFLQPGYGSVMLQDMNGTWYKEGNPKTEITTNGVYNGPLPLVNGNDGADFTEPSSTTGIIIKDNLARDGGGIAANGTVIFGRAKDEFRYDARVNIHKTWDNVPVAEREDIKIQVGYGDPSTDEFNILNTTLIKETDASNNPQNIELTLDGTSGDIGNYSDAVAGETSGGKNKDQWSGYVTIPSAIDGVALYKFETPAISQLTSIPSGAFTAEEIAAYNSKTELDPSKPSDLKYLYYIAKYHSDLLKVKAGTSKIKIRETNTKYDKTYNLNLTVDNIKYTERPTTLIEPASGAQHASFNTCFTSISVGVGVTNTTRGVDLTLTKVATDSTNNAKWIKNAKFIVAEIQQDTPSKDFRVAGTPGTWNPSASEEIQTKTILDVAQKDSSGEMAVYTSGNNGSFTIQNLKPGKKYFLFEYEPAAGYVATSSPWIIDVATNGTPTVVAIDPNAKYDSQNGSQSVVNKVITNRPQRNEILDDFIVNDSTNTKNRVWHAYWRNNWFYNDNGTPKNPVTNGQIGNSTADIKITKVDSEGEPIKDAVFAFADVGYESDKTKVFFSKAGVIKKDNKYLTVTSDDEGKINITPIINALDPTSNGNNGQGRMEPDSIWLWMFELDAPENYKQKTAPWLINIAKDKTVRIYEYKDPYVYPRSPIQKDDAGNWTVWDNAAVNGNTNQQVRTIPLADFNISTNAQNNRPISTSNGTTDAQVENKTDIKLTKVDGKTGSTVLGTKFRLYKADRNIEFDEKGNITSTGTIGVQSVEINEIDAADGTVEIGAPNAGTYLLFETQAASRYERRKEPWLIHVNADGSYRMAIYNYEYLSFYGKKNADSTTEEWHAKAIKSDAFNSWSKLNGYLDSGKIKYYLKSDSTNRFTELVGDDKGKLKNKPMDLTIVKKSSVGNQALVGVEFDLYNATREEVIDKNGVKHFEFQVNGNRINKDGDIVSGDGGSFTLPALEPGHIYMFFEKDPLPGYKKPNAPWGIEVDGDGVVKIWRLKKSGDAGYNPTSVAQYSADTNPSNVKILCTDMIETGSFEITNERKPIELTKVDEDGNAITVQQNSTEQKAKFVITDAVLGKMWYVSGSHPNEGGNENTTIISQARKDTNGDVIYYEADNNGKITIADLPAGNYFLFETQAPTGFVRATTPWLIQVTDNEIGRSWNIFSIKEDYRDMAKGLDSKDKTLSPDDLKIAATWWPDSWFEDESVQNLENRPKYITKVDADNTNALLEGAEFTLYEAYTETDLDYYNRPTGNIWIRMVRGDGITLKSDSMGRIELPSSITRKETVPYKDPKHRGQREGYLLVETKAPNGYKTSATPWWITVDSNGNVTVKYTTHAIRDNLENYDWWYTSDFTNSNGLVKNTPNETYLTKVDKYTNEKLEGAEFMLYKAKKSNDYHPQYSKAETDGKPTSRSDSNGKITLPTLEPGDYILEETKAPEGYEKSKTPWVVTITRYTYYYGDTYKVESWPLYEVDGKPGYWVTNSTICNGMTTVENIPSVNLKKVDVATVAISEGDDGEEIISAGDTTKFLEGVKFKLYESNENTWTKKSETAVHVSGTNPEGTVVTDKDGVLELGSLTAGGRYLLYEVEAKEGYILPSAPWRIKIGSDGKIENLWVPADENGTEYKDTNHKTYLTNTEIYNLPSAGGMGTYWFMIIGAMMMGFALTAGFTKMNLLKLLRR